MLTITEARKNIFQLADEVQTPDNVVVLTERGKPKVVLMSFDDFDSLTETLSVLQENPDILIESEKAHSEYRRGESVVLEDGGERAFSSPKNQKKDGKKHETNVHGRSSKKRTKGNR